MLNDTDATSGVVTFVPCFRM